MHTPIDQQLMIVLLVYMPSDWSTAHLSLNTLLLAYMPSDWSIAHPCLSTLLLFMPPSDWPIAYSSPPSYWLNPHLIG